MEAAAARLAEEAKNMALGVGRAGPLAVEQVDGAGRIEAERKRPAAARQRQGDVAQGAVAADRADMARLGADMDGEAGPAFGKDHRGAARLETGLQRGEPARAMAAGGAVVEELDGRARHRRSL